MPCLSAHSRGHRRLPGNRGGEAPGEAAASKVGMGVDRQGLLNNSKRSNDIDASSFY